MHSCRFINEISQQPDCTSFLRLSQRVCTVVLYLTKECLHCRFVPHQKSVCTVILYLTKECLHYRFVPHQKSVCTVVLYLIKRVSALSFCTSSKVSTPLFCTPHQIELSTFLGVVSSRLRCSWAALLLLIPKQAKRSIWYRRLSLTMR